ncbi:MAG TPA: hypothetical protein VGQ64_03870 [Candidatus Limnocylindrales bacterium]|jgi:hypothetical protein|nr:hypothetical protein [Candidatus Limnocylindrales bacterium]
MTPTEPPAPDAPVGASSKNVRSPSETVQPAGGTRLSAGVNVVDEIVLGDAAELGDAKLGDTAGLGDPVELGPPTVGPDKSPKK